MYNKIALDWRLKGQRYRLEGVACPHCGKEHFPPRGICAECGHPMNGMVEIVDSAAIGRDVVQTPAPFTREEKREPALAKA